MAFVHHTDTGNDYTQADAPAIVRAIYAYHTKTLGWNDIGYDFLIDDYGTIYEGRYGGVAKGVVGAQVLGFNTGSTGIAIIGTYTTEAPSAAALASLEKLLAWKLSLTGLDPLGTAQMTCGTTQKFKAGAKVTLPVVAGHRDANYTDCPGDALYALLPTVRTAVAALMDPASWIVSLQLSAPAITVNSSVTYSGTVTDPAGAPSAGAVTIQRRSAAGGAWVRWRTAALGAGGAYKLAVKMTSSNTWQFRVMMPASPTLVAGYSAAQVLAVKKPAWRVSLGLSKASVRAGRLVRYSGTVKTVSGRAGAGAVAIQRRVAAGGPWKVWRTAALSARGGYTVRVRMTGHNAWQVRARMPATAANLAGSSSVKSLTVR